MMKLVCMVSPYSSARSDMQLCLLLMHAHHCQVWVFTVIQTTSVYICMADVRTDAIINKKGSHGHLHGPLVFHNKMLV